LAHRLAPAADFARWELSRRARGATSRAQQAVDALRFKQVRP